MSNTIATITVILLCLVVIKAKAQTPVAVNQLISTDIDQEKLDIIYEQAKQFPDSTQVSIAIVEGDKISYIGIERSADTLRLVDNHHNTFEIGSITKVFTSHMLSDLVSKGSVQLDEPFTTYVDWKPFFDAPITLQQLSNHSSGLPRLPANMGVFTLMSANPYSDYDDAKLIEYMTTSAQLEYDPGTNNAYSNLGAGLLGYILTQVTSKSYEELLQEQIFTKYNMGLSTSDRSKAKDLVKGRNAQGKVTSNWDFDDALVGAGGIISTVEDLAQFAKAHMDTSAPTISRMQNPTYKLSDRMQVGLGWHILTKDTRDWLWHNGGTGGYTSSMAIDVASKKSVMILSNVSALGPQMGKIDMMCFELLKQLD